MKNILLVLIPTFTAYAGFIGAIVYNIVKRPKYYGIQIVVFTALIVALTILEFPIYTDMIEQDTTTVIAEYVEFQSGNTLPCTRKAYFKTGENTRFFVYVPTWTRDIAKMEIGETYEIEYFLNSCVIKSYKLIEQNSAHDM